MPSNRPHPASPPTHGEIAPGLEGQGNVGQLLSQGQEVQVHSWQMRFSLWGNGCEWGPEWIGDLPIPGAGGVRETHKAVGLGPNLGEQFPGEL